MVLQISSCLGNLQSEKAPSGLCQCYQQYILPRNTVDTSRQFSLFSMPESSTKVQIPTQSDSIEALHRTAELWGFWIMEVLRTPTSAQRPSQSQQETIILQMAGQACPGKPDCPLLLKGTASPSLALLQDTLTLRKLLHLTTPENPNPSKSGQFSNALVR